MVLLDFLDRKLRDPLFHLGILTSSLLISDAYIKLFINHAPTRLLWYCTVGLWFTTMGLFRRSSLLLTSMFSGLFVIQTVWTISYLQNVHILKTGIDINGMTAYIFAPDSPKLWILITIYHLFLIPFLVLGLLTVRKVNKYGWLLAYLLVVIVSFMAYFFPDPNENVNCIQVRPKDNICNFFFSHFYQFSPLPLIGIFLATSALALFVFLPTNLLLLFLANKLGWKR